MATRDATDDTFGTEVFDSDLPVIVDLWAEWCGPCKEIEPALEERSEELEGEVKFVRLDVDDNPAVPTTVDVRGIPTRVLYRNGDVVSKQAGAIPTADLRSWIESSG